MSDDEFRQKMKEAVQQFSEAKQVDEEVWNSFAQGLYYLTADIGNSEDYQKLSDLLDRIDRERGTSGNRLFYLSVAPRFYAEAVEQLGRAGLAKPKDRAGYGSLSRSRFGTDLESARLLNKQILEHLDESQIYRIDHYLGKETVQNLLAFRFANGIFEPLWNRQYIDHVQMTNAEAVGVEGRGGYYEGAGVVRDMIQNHVFQVLSLVAMEPPAHLGSEAVRDEKIKAMTAAREFTAERVRTSVCAGSMDLAQSPGSLSPAIGRKMASLPIQRRKPLPCLRSILTTGDGQAFRFTFVPENAFQKRVTEIAIQFQAAPHHLFGADVMEQVAPNQLIIRIQPDEGITLRFAVKVPGQITHIRDVNMDFRYGSSFGVQLAEAYESLLLDCILGDSTLYARKDMTERGWEIVMPDTG